MSCVLHSAANSFNGSRLNGVAWTMLNGLALESNIANPSCCFDVITMYFMPADFARSTISAALNRVGLNPDANALYFATGIDAEFMIHSPIPGTSLPSHRPAGIE